MPARVCFYLRPETFEPSYELTKDLREQLWYQRNEMQEIRAQVEHQVDLIASRNCRASVNACQRGLEHLIRDKVSKRSLRYEEYSKYVEGFQRLQSRQQLLGRTDEEQLCKYSCRQSQRHRSLAELVATRDAMNCSKIYQEDNSWKLLMPQQGSISTKPQSQGSRLWRSEGFKAKRNLFVRPKLRRSQGLLQSTHIRPGHE